MQSSAVAHAAVGGPRPAPRPLAMPPSAMPPTSTIGCRCQAPSAAISSPTSSSARALAPAAGPLRRPAHSRGRRVAAAAAPPNAPTTVLMTPPVTTSYSSFGSSTGSYASDLDEQDEPVGVPDEEDLELPEEFPIPHGARGRAWLRAGGRAVGSPAAPRRVAPHRVAL
ncbi:hypothetical protein GPECTOR_10g1077 [Gonium pectorale]|uniref:Uncharacterized protein n=1 Tax=Gonium pectorale TaxID=33097 RepID=A0A150GQJ0_GONPE|nr:hypothetical protein GPECTOR_10g1077 [Gonium pectorale]|eukprot:KXZ52054.1 hypothetical protein GPECTOR_10g1077 [Gonium pectorale]